MRLRLLLIICVNNNMLYVGFGLGLGGGGGGGGEGCAQACVWDSSLNDRTFVVCYIHYENTLYSKFNFLILVFTVQFVCS